MLEVYPDRVVKVDPLLRYPLLSLAAGTALIFTAAALEPERHRFLGTALRLVFRRD